MGTEFFFPRVWRDALLSADTSSAEVTSPNPETLCGKSLALRVLWAHFISFLAWVVTVCMREKSAFLLVVLTNVLPERPNFFVYVHQHFLGIF